MWSYCTECRWFDLGPYEVILEQKDLHVVLEKNGKQHNILVGGALERQRHRTAPPGQRPLTEPELERKQKPVMTSKEQYQVLCPGYEKFVEETTQEAPPPAAVQVAEEEPELVSLESLLEDQEAEQESYESDAFYKDEQEEPPQIDPLDWYEVTIIRNSEKSLTALTQTEQHVHIHKDVITESPGQHTCSTYIPIGSRAMCRLKYSPPDRFCPFEGIELVAKEISTVTQETGKVIKWDNGHYGRILRECGCGIFGTNRGWTTLYPNNEVEFDVEWTTHKGRSEYVAKNITPTGQENNL